MKYWGYAECSICKDQNGPWIEVNQTFYCEDCYEKLKKGEIKLNVKSNKNKFRHRGSDAKS